MRTIIIGLGNPLLKDDSVGLRVAQALHSELSDRSDVVVTEDYWGGLRLMEQMIGFDRAIIIDAICTQTAPAGALLTLEPQGIPTQRSASAHDVNLPTALAFGRKAGAHLPENDQITLIGIEAADVTTFEETLSPEVERAVPAAVEAVLAVISKEKKPI